MEQNQSFEKVFNDVLVDNTAQDIYNEIYKLQQEANANKRRWVWELCQNALDSAEDKVSIEVEIKDHAVVFRHNGHPFTGAEIAHLIYHGSTKREMSGKLGKWGTGFLTTHLLSKLTRVTGITNDKKGSVLFWTEVVKQ